jgi:O-methyltransferase
MASAPRELSQKQLKRYYRPRLFQLPRLDRPETLKQKVVRASRRARYLIVPALFNEAWECVTDPAAAFFILSSPRVHPAYRMTVARKAKLAWRMRRTTRKVVTGSSWRAHLAMAAKLLEIPPEVEGVVVECGAFQGGSTANLSLVCDIVGRDLIVYDSFEGLPPPTPGDRIANVWGTGMWAGSLDAVQRHVRRYGAIDRCTFRKGWFADTLPQHTERVVLCYLDVDYQASLHDCLTNLWPKLVDDKGYLFVDDYPLLELCALFWSETYWKRYFDSAPPGLIGSGSGVALGHFYLGPFPEPLPAHRAGSVGYTRKDQSGLWDFFPDAAPRASRCSSGTSGADRQICAP